MGVRDKNYPEGVELGSAPRRVHRVRVPPRERPRESKKQSSSEIWDTIELIFWLILFLGPGTCIVLYFLIYGICWMLFGEPSWL